MNLDETYISLFGYTVFEPGTIVTNLVFFALCLLYSLKLVKFRHQYARQMSFFILFMGVSSLFGAVAHGVHKQLGESFFNGVFFVMNALSLFAIYYCFRAPYTYHKLDSERPRLYVNIAMTWVLALLVFSFIKGDFLIIKIHAAISLIYSFGVHYIAYRKRNEQGSKLIILGIGISFLSIIVHSAHFSIHAWFNYKDLAHIIMIVSLIMIYQGIRQNLEVIDEELSEQKA